MSLALGALLPAQLGRAPTEVGSASFSVLGPSAHPGSAFAGVVPAVTAVHSLELLPLLDTGGALISGRFHGTCTVTRQAGASTEILLGTLDTTAVPWTFAETTAADLGGLVTVGFANATMTPDLLVFAADTPAVSVYSVRTSRALPFPPPKPIGAGTGLVDSKLFRWRGQDWLADVNGAFIEVWRFDRGRFATNGDPRVAGYWGLVGSPGPYVHAPALLIDRRGEARAIAHAADDGGPGTMARPYYNGLLQLNNTERSRRFHSGPADATQLDHPAAIAGSTFYATRDPMQVFVDPERIDVVASSGDTVGSGGGTFELSAWLPYFERNRPPAMPWVLTIMIGVPANDLTIPGFHGKLALAPGLVVLPARLWNAEDLSADWTLAAPPLPAGTLLWAQTLAYDPAARAGGAGFYFGNTARLLWQ